MWQDLGTSISHAEGAWEEALAKDNLEIPFWAATTASNCLIACKRLNEVFLGGDDSPCIVQVLCASIDDQGEDMIASVLLPEDEVRVVYTARGTSVLQLLTSFCKFRPSAPVLIPHDGLYSPVMCKLEGCDWSAGVLSGAHVQLLQKAGYDKDMALQIYVESTTDDRQSAEAQRAARVRPASVIREPTEEISFSSSAKSDVSGTEGDSTH